MNNTGVDSAPPDPAVALSKSISIDALEAYKSGEMDLLQTLKVVDRIAARASPSMRLAIIGGLAIRALYIEPKQINRSKPPYPKWLKKLAVDWVFLFQEIYADPSADLERRSAAGTRLGVIGMLAELGLYPVKQGGELLSEATLRKWCHERQRASGKVLPRGRPRRK